MEPNPPENPEEWELLPPNTSFLNLGLAEIKDLFSKEIDYIDYFIENPQQKQQQNPLQQSTESKNQVYESQFVPETEAEDPKQSEVEESGGIDEEEQKGLVDTARSGRRRPLVAGLSEVISIGAAVAAAMVCGFLIGSGRRQERVRRDGALSFCLYEDDEAMKQMVRQAKRINRVLVMQPATISFRRCFNDVL